MAEFKIAKVSSAEPRSWSFTDKRTGDKVQMETYKIMLEGVDEPVEINRKPGNIPSVGDVLTGTIEESDFGRRFKADPKPRPAFPQKDTNEIKAEWAIGQAVALNGVGPENDLERIELVALRLFHMVGRIKTSSAPPSGYDRARATAGTLAKSAATQKVDDIFDITDEPVNLEDIPF